MFGLPYQVWHLLGVGIVLGVYVIAIKKIAWLDSKFNVLFAIVAASAMAWAATTVGPYSFEDLGLTFKGSSEALQGNIGVTIVGVWILRALVSQPKWSADMVKAMPFYALFGVVQAFACWGLLGRPLADLIAMGLVRGGMTESATVVSAILTTVIVGILFGKVVHARWTNRTLVGLVSVAGMMWVGTYFVSGTVVWSGVSLGVLAPVMYKWVEGKSTWDNDIVPMLRLVKLRST